MSFLVEKTEACEVCVCALFGTLAELDTGRQIFDKD